MSANLAISKSSLGRKVWLVFLACAVVIWQINFSPVQASTESELQADLDAIIAEQEASEAELKAISQQVDSLENKLATIQVEVDIINLQIEETTTRISKLKLQLEAAEKELAIQKNLLAESLKVLYIEGNVTTLDLILASSEFNDFISQQEYLTTLKSNVETTTHEVLDLKAEIEANKVEQEELLARQKASQTELLDKKAQQQSILNQTKGQESVYQGIVSDLQKKRDAAEDALNDYLASLSGSVSLGPVEEGEYIGGVGNTGYSSGPHLHFKIYTGSTIGPGVNPQTTINNKGWVWPVGGYGGYVTQGWGCSSLGVYHWYNGCSWHDALDIGGVPIGTPVYATGAGDIVHRGCLYQGTMFSTYGIVIAHSGGYYSLYIHMVAPDADVYDGCRYNTYW